MSALCGIVDYSAESLIGRPCQTMLDAQRVYGCGMGRTSDLGPAQFGMDVRGTLAEDRFDAQPMLASQTLLVADIRLDNRAELLELLGLNNSIARSLADSGLLARAWEQWGEGCLTRIVGDFAIAAFCSRNKSLTLARDTTGQRPLYYARYGRKVAFSSMPCGILALNGFRQGFDQRSLVQVLLDTPPGRGATCFAGVSKVPPGELLRLGPSSSASKELWQPDFAELRLPRQADYVHAYREVLERAVATRMRRSRGAIAAHLSSGFDSGAVAATAALSLGGRERLLALTAAPPIGFERISPRNRIPDESSMAALTARKHGMRHIVVRTAAPIAERLRAQAKLYQDPYRNLINAGWLLAIEQAARTEGASVLLAADLGNLTLNAGGLRTLADICQRRGLLAWAREAWAARHKQDVRWKGILFNSFGDRIPVGLQQLLINVFQGVVPKRRLTFLKEEMVDDLRKLPNETYGISSSDSYREGWNYLRTLDYGNIRKASLAETGVETRDPMADRRVIEFATRLPPEQLLHDGISRPLAKVALSDRVPRDVLRSSVRGYQAAHWPLLIDEEAMRDLVDEIASSTTVDDILDIAKMRRALDRWSTIEVNNFEAYELFAGHLPQALAVGLFIKEFED